LKHRFKVINFISNKTRRGRELFNTKFRERTMNRIIRKKMIKEFNEKIMMRIMDRKMERMRRKRFNRKNIRSSRVNKGR
jgi:hypothetical protein